MCFYSLLLTIAKFVYCGMHRNLCPSQPSDGYLLVVFLLVESILFGLFTLCMLGDQISTIATNMTQIDRLKLQQAQAQSSQQASKPQRVPSTVANTLMHEINEVFGGSIHAPWSYLDLFRYIYPTPVPFHQYPQCPVIMGYRCTSNEHEKDGQDGDKEDTQALLSSEERKETNAIEMVPTSSAINGRSGQSNVILRTKGSAKGGLQGMQGIQHQQQLQRGRQYRKDSLDDNESDDNDSNEEEDDEAEEEDSLQEIGSNDEGETDQGKEQDPLIQRHRVGIASIINSSSNKKSNKKGKEIIRITSNGSDSTYYGDEEEGITDWLTDNPLAAVAATNNNPSNSNGTGNNIPNGKPHPYFCIPFVHD